MIGSFWWLVLVVFLGVSLALRHGRLFLFTVLLLLATGASALWARYCLAGIRYRRQLASNRLAFGAETELTVEIVNAKPLPLAWLQAHDEWPRDVVLLTGRLGYTHKPSRRALENRLALRWYERVRRTYRLCGAQRGAFDFGPVTLTSGDIFGFRWRDEMLDTTDTLLVYPKVVPVWRWRLPSGRPLGELLARRRVVEDPLRFAGVRDYVPGDNPRHIHWKNSARWRQLQTRVFDPEANQAAVLVVDVQTSDRGAYWVVPGYLELVISAAASIGLYLLDQRQAVGLYANGVSHGRQGLVRVPASRNPAQPVRLLEALARLTGFRMAPCADILHRAIRALPWGATVIVLSARLERELQAALLRVREAGHPVVLLTVGEAPTLAPPGVEAHHLGGQDAWTNLATLELA